MTSEWEFLKPWHTVLLGSLTTSGDSQIRISFRAPVRHDSRERLFVEIPMDAKSRRNVVWLQQIREAMELFVVLSVVNNAAFREFFAPDNGNSLDCHYPVWWLCPTGILASDDPAANQSPVSWSTLLGFSDDPSIYYSPEFRSALEKLQELGLEEASKKSLIGRSAIGWCCDFSGSYHLGLQDFNQSADTVSAFVAVTREMFSARAPPVVQLLATCGEAKIMKILQTQPVPDTPSASVMATISNTMLAKPTRFVDYVAALAASETTRFSLNFERATTDTLQDTMNVGLLLNTLLCGNPLCVSTSGHAEEISLLPTRSHFDNLDFRCSSVSSTVFEASCSAVADFRSATNLSKVTVSDLGAERWSWLMYAICCGASNATAPTVKMVRGKLTKPDLLTIETILRTCYPRPILQQRPVSPAQYGFVDISAGTEFQLGGNQNGGNTLRVVSGAYRFRARYNPADEDNNVQMIVPGYGACKARLGDSIRFIPDSKNSMLATKRVAGSLKLHYVKVENTALLMDLLALVTRGLRCLSLREDERNLNQLDLTALSAACPDLQTLSTNNFTVVVSVHDDVLRRWSIKEIDITATRCISDLTPCLTDRSLRMSRELVKLMVTSPAGERFNDVELTQLQAHDGEFLPVMKEKLPLHSKTAMISVVTSPNGFQAIRRVDAHVLSLIFVFASTPAQKSVLVCEWP